MMRLSHYNGNPYVGVYCSANEEIAFVPRDAPSNLLKDVQEALEVKVEKASISNTNLIGCLLSINSSGAVVSNMATDSELEFLSRFLAVYRIEDKLNASGNNILANDYGAIVNRGRETLVSHPKSGDAADYRPLVHEIVKFMQTGVPAVSNEETLEIFAFLDAAQRSKEQGGKPVALR